MQQEIESNRYVMLGKPVIKGTRIAVELILRKLAQGATPNDILEMYPSISQKDVNSCLLFATDTIANDEEIFQTI
jgi:uncharacterized protein (DUF433 family)